MSRPAGLLELMREDLRMIMAQDPSIRSRREAILHPSLPALWTHRVAHALYRHDLRWTARLLSCLARLVSGGIEIHPGARLGRRVFIDHGAAVVVGETAVIGDDVTIYHQVTLGAVGWWTDMARPPGERRHPRIGNRVSIGANATVLGPVTIGDDAIVGAQALVVEDIPAEVKVLAPKAVPVERRRPDSALDLLRITADDDTRLPRLIDRHIRFGQSPAEAEAWARGSDEVNAEYIRLFRLRADLIINASDR